MNALLVLFTECWALGRLASRDRQVAGQYAFPQITQTLAKWATEVRRVAAFDYSNRVMSMR